MDIEPSEQEPEYEVDKIIGKRLGKDKQMEYLILWKGYPDSEATWESSDVVEDLQALDEFEEACKDEDKLRAVILNKEYIKDNWNKNHVSRYIMNLAPPTDLNLTTTSLANTLKRHKVDGEKLIQLTVDVLEEMAIPHTACKWLCQQLDTLYNGDSGYSIRV